jgi:hypothetical protein
MDTSNSENSATVANVQPSNVAADASGAKKATPQTSKVCAFLDKSTSKPKKKKQTAAAAAAATTQTDSSNVRRHAATKKDCMLLYPRHSVSLTILTLVSQSILPRTRTFSKQQCRLLRHHQSGKHIA